MEQFISTSEANQNFSAVMRRVKKGERFVVTSRGEEVAEIIPRGKKRPSEIQELMDFLEAQPRRTLPNWTREDAYD
jgi:prevent-host-death family protein